MLLEFIPSKLASFVLLFENSRQMKKGRGLYYVTLVDSFPLDHFMNLNDGVQHTKLNQSSQKSFYI
jgi:hypothetical protein